MMQQSLDEDDLQELEEFERHTDTIVRFGAGMGHQTVKNQSLGSWQSFQASRSYQDLTEKFSNKQTFESQNKVQD